MEIYLVRHADALEAGPGCGDAARPLSQEGRDKMQKAARGMKNLLAERTPALDAVLSSPKVRARETALILAREVNSGGEMVECPALAGGYRWADLLPHLRRYSTDARVALVGHEPDLGSLSGWLVAGHDRAVIPLKKGSIIAFELEAAAEPEARLLWLLTPKQLRMLG